MKTTFRVLLSMLAFHALGFQLINFVFGSMAQYFGK